MTIDCVRRAADRQCRTYADGGRVCGGSAESARETLAHGESYGVLALVCDQRSVTRLPFGIHADAHRAAPSQRAIGRHPAAAALNPRSLNVARAARPARPSYRTVWICSQNRPPSPS